MATAQDKLTDTLTIDPDTIPGREALERWDAHKPDNFYDANPLLRRLLTRLRGAEVDHKALSGFGAIVAQAVDVLAMENDRLGNHPRVERFDGLGTRLEGVVFHPTYHAAGKPAYDAGVIACLKEPGMTWFQSTLFYLLGHCGEMGHLCPITCTSGLVRAVQQKGSAELKEKWLPGLLTASYEEKLHGSQFLTEVQGGSDVGSNILVARKSGGAAAPFRLYGEKWFCSVADGDLFIVTARPEGAPEGTAGLGCFLVPRRLDDGKPNHFALRRLKDKIGTRTLATAEIDFEGSYAWPVGRLDEGFKIAVGVVLNTSRFMNALGCASAMRRAYLEAASYAAFREAFGAPILKYPLVRETLAIMKTEEAAALLSSFYLSELIDLMDKGEATEEDEAAHRILVNVNKYWTSVMASDVTRRGIEVLGGNGTIETFSVMPRLYRDAIVLEAWEGSHNVLCMQVLRDAQKLGLFDVVDRRLRDLAGKAKPRFAEEIATLETAWSALRPKLDRCLKDAAYAATHVKRHLESLMQAFQNAVLFEQAAWDAEQGETTDTAAMARFHQRRWLDPAYRADEDPDYLAGIDAVLAGDPIFPESASM
ncbi:MAG: acyl-CoA dehydrogenase family protein [Deltaproteobacteria bacterium]|nr:acyl-CoA dehydrogenase family protein [Deltaproteobacteria bacterium]